MNEFYTEIALIDNGAISEDNLLVSQQSTTDSSGFMTSLSYQMSGILPNLNLCKNINEVSSSNLGRAIA